MTSIVALPYDWRLSPEKLESRDGFLTLTRKKIEAAVESNGRPGIMVAHSVRYCTVSFIIVFISMYLQLLACRTLFSLPHYYCFAACSFL